ncbi:glycosyl hydrolase [Marinilabilia rubra]|uniref:Asl1-like glycosyl hydrolase catalytic domain-containing protein n=1 Tax=Marinilabilia rubra TaxID=2162893 RepID=A0A2U2BB71_9BACT|nr:glycosyl hydrolase [Marinilabilia rubra]PWE00322.1 hypothetical protein DDZ16_05115 [Marinilabilia rubra]
MQKIIISIFMIMAALTGCEGIYSGQEFKIYEHEEPEGSQLPEIPEIGKKGIGKTTKDSDWSSKVSKLKIHWHYTWGNNLSIKEPDNVDYVPMIWGKNSIDEAKVDDLKTLRDEGKINFLLGFNEPDGEKQSNMTVAEAIEIWPLLEEVGVPLGSPAVVGIDNEWLTEFMAQVDANGLRVDFICVHKYGGPNAQGFLNKLDEVYAKYGLPIWITEFGVGDWKATTLEEHKYTPEQVLAFMQELLPELEDRSYIHRYAWFPAEQDHIALKTSALWDAEGVLTPLGEFYANFEPNDLIGPGKDDLVGPDELNPNSIVVNGGFESGVLDPWQGFKNGVSEIEPYAGLYCGNIRKKDGSLYQVVEVEPGATYEITFYGQWAEYSENTFNVVVKEETGDKAILLKEPIEANENGWTKNQVTFTASQETQVRLVWYKGKLKPAFPPFYLDNVECVKVE